MKKEIKKEETLLKKSSLPLRKRVFGWLSYVGFWCLFVFPIIDWILKGKHAYISFGMLPHVRVPIYGLFFGHFSVRYLGLMGIILTLILPWASFYKLGSKKMTLLLRLFPTFLIVLAIAVHSELFMIFLYGACFIWYLHYFYKKSKSGYRHVFIKVITFSLISFLPLFFSYKSDCVLPFLQTNCHTEWVNLFESSEIPNKSIPESETFIGKQFGEP